MIWLYRSPIPVRRKRVISSFKWFLPAYATRRGMWEGVSSPCGHNILERTKMLPEAHSRIGNEIQTEIKKSLKLCPFLRFPQRDRGVREKAQKRWRGYRTRRKVHCKKYISTRKDDIRSWKHNVIFLNVAVRNKLNIGREPKLNLVFSVWYLNLQILLQKSRIGYMLRPKRMPKNAHCRTHRMGIPCVHA